MLCARKPFRTRRMCSERNTAVISRRGVIGSSSRPFNRKPKMFQFIPFATPWPSPAISGLVTTLATASRRITNEDYERLALLKGIREAPRDELRDGAACPRPAELRGG